MGVWCCSPRKLQTFLKNCLEKCVAWAADKWTGILYGVIQLSYKLDDNCWTCFHDGLELLVFACNRGLS